MIRVAQAVNVPGGYWCDRSGMDVQLTALADRDAISTSAAAVKRRRPWQTGPKGCVGLVGTSVARQLVVGV